MKNIGRLFFSGILGAVVLSTALPAPARPPKTEDELLAALSSPKDKDVYSALQDLEKNYPSDAKIIPPIKGLLADPRPVVRRKAARVLGAIHADVSDADIKNICALLNSTDKREVTDGLIALRGLKAQSAIPQILPLLDNPDSNIKRDSCRTLAVLGDKSLIPKIKPLLDYPDVSCKKTPPMRLTS